MNIRVKNANGWQERRNSRKYENPLMKSRILKLSYKLYTWTKHELSKWRNETRLLWRRGSAVAHDWSTSLYLQL
jgi:hypothetical protein